MSASGAPFDLTGRIAIVTGANTGLGQGIALALGAAGADVAAVGRKDPQETRAALQKLGRRCHWQAADLAARPDHAELLAGIESALGPADILVNNAGIIRRADALDFTEQDWDEVMETNLRSAFFLTQAFARRVLARGATGKVINVASMLSFQGGIRVASYTASKSGIAGLTRLLACEWAGRGMNVNAIAPGYFATSNTVALREDAARNRDILARIPAGRWGDPADLGGAAVFLASRAADYVHGVVLPVDGGWLAR